MATQKIRNTTGRPQNVLELENKLNNKITKEILPDLPSFVTKYNDSLANMNRSVKTRKAYMEDIAHFLKYMTEDTGLSEGKTAKDVSLSDMENLKATDVDSYLSYVMRYELDDGTVVENGPDARARKRSSIVGLLKFLYKKDYIEHDITGKIDPISVKDSARTVIALQENEVMDLLDIVATGQGLTSHEQAYWEKTKYRDKFIITLFVVTGLRISELQQLNLSSFNLKREEFEIFRKRGKKAVMPMNTTLLDAYNEYMEMDRGHCTDIAPGHEDALFLCLTSKTKGKDGKMIPMGRKRLSVDQIRALVKKYTCIATGGSGVSPHKLRATAATTAIRRGTDISRLASLLDHDSVTTTQRYIKSSEEDKRLVIQNMIYELE